jgi:hypothetical protein
MKIAVRRIGGKSTLREFLQGTWKFNRSMTHTENGRSLGSVHNATATFSPVEAVTQNGNSTTNTTNTNTEVQHQQLLYREEGNVIFGKVSANSTSISFYREYLYTFISPTSADVSFWRPNNEEEHMKFFHNLQVSEEGVGATSEHLCIDDLYRATIQILSDCNFNATWVVDGPNKKYTIKTEFTRKLNSETIADSCNREQEQQFQESQKM